MASLVQKLNEADPHFIRCVKPNPEKVPDKFASPLALEQLTCSGVFEARGVSLGLLEGVFKAFFRWF